MIRIVGLGPSKLDKISVGAYRVLCSAPTVFVRTARHPAVEEMEAEGIRIEPLDHIYDEAQTFEEVYSRIAERILQEAEQGDVVYAVPGHPLIGESAVRIIIDEAKGRGFDYEIIGSQSFIEASLEAVGVSFSEGLKIIDAFSMDHVSPSPDTDTLIYQVYDRTIASDVKLRLMDEYPDEHEIAVIKAEEVRWAPLYMLDRVEVDHLTSVWVPGLKYGDASIPSPLEGEGQG